MNIRKLFMSAIVAVMTLASATCFAQISSDDLVIGGMYPGQPWSEVINMYGQPSMTQITREGITEYIFRNTNKGSFELHKENERITHIGVVNKIMSTARGIRNGASKQEIINAYGQPDDIVIQGQLENLDYYANNGKLRFSLYQNKSEWIYSSGSAGSSKPSQPQEPTKPKSTIPKHVTQIPASELVLGWIEPGQAMSHVEEVYGKPGKIDDQGFFQIYSYNDKFIVKGKMSNGYKVTSVASYEKGIKTPSGFMVGDAYSAITKKFGPVNGVKFKGDEMEAKMKNLKGCTDYTYFSGKKQMVFLVDKKGIIQAIRVEDYDEQKFIEARRKK